VLNFFHQVAQAVEWLARLGPAFDGTMFATTRMVWTASKKRQKTAHGVSWGCGQTEQAPPEATEIVHIGSAAAPMLLRRL
jgi:hypothetical protein